MKKLGLLLWSVLLTQALPGAELHPLPWSKGTNAAGRFQANSSGRMTIAADADSGGVRFDTEFPEGVGYWCYPYMDLFPYENLADAEVMRFEIKVSPETEAGGVNEAYVIFGDETPYHPIPIPDGEFREVAIEVAKAVKDPAAARRIQIGMNPRENSLSFTVRNLEFLSSNPNGTSFKEEDYQPMPWSQAFLSAGRFMANSSGQMTITDDPAGGVRFDTVFPEGVGYWCYPAVNLLPAESLAKVDVITFEIKVSPETEAGGINEANFIFGNETPYYRFFPPSSEFQQVVIPIAKAVKDPATVRQIQVGMNPVENHLSFTIRNLKFLTSDKVKVDLDAAQVIEAAAPGTAFLQGEALDFTLNPYATRPAAWILRDWKNTELSRGDWPGGGRETLTLPALPNGYYLLEARTNDGEFSGVRSFAVVPDPGRRVRNPKMFYAIDSGQSWLARPDPANPRQPRNAFEVVSDLVYRSGTAMVRERMSWSEVEQEPGKLNLQVYKLNADLLGERGIEISGMYHDAPAWTKTNTSSLPDDLIATYRSARALAAALRGRMTVWEFWNEQDIGFALEGAWDYAAAFKAASLGYQAGAPEAAVAIGGFAHTPLAPYVDVVMANGAAAYMDIFNVHSYRPLRDFPETMEDVRALLKRHGAEELPVWFTENGSHVEGSGRSASYMDGLKAHSPEQELLIAEFLPKMMIYMQSLGVDRDFFFVLPPYNENDGNKDWGLMRRDYSVKPGYAAFANLADQLGNMAYEGEVRLGDNLKGYLYRGSDGGKTLVYWSLSELDLESQRPDLTPADLREQVFSLPLSGVLSGVDFLGTPFLADAARMTASRFPAFVSGVDSLKADIPRTAPASPAGSGENFARDIIFRADFSDDFKLSAGKDFMNLETENAPLTLQVVNLSDRPQEGRIAVKGGAVSGLPQQISVPAFGQVELPLAFSAEFDPAFQGEFRVEGNFDGKPATPLVVPLRNQSQIVAEGHQTAINSMVDPSNWRTNASGRMEILYDAAESAIRFRTVFPPEVDRWVYPEYTLQLPQESLKGALGIGFETRVSDAAAVRQMLVMAVPGAKTEVLLPVEAPGETWEERFVQIPPSLNPDEITMLRLGLNSFTDDITYWIRNVRIFYAR